MLLDGKSVLVGSVISVGSISGVAFTSVWLYKKIFLNQAVPDDRWTNEAAANVGNMGNYVFPLSVGGSSILATLLSNKEDLHGTSVVVGVGLGALIVVSGIGISLASTWLYQKIFSKQIIMNAAGRIRPPAIYLFANGGPAAAGVNGNNAGVVAPPLVLVPSWVAVEEDRLEVHYSRGDVAAEEINTFM